MKKIVENIKKILQFLKNVIKWCHKAQRFA